MGDQSLPTKSEMIKNLGSKVEIYRQSDSVNRISSKVSVPTCPWEWWKMKGELIALKAKVSYHEATIQQLHKKQYEKDEVFQKEKNLLKIKVEQYNKTIKQLEARIDVGRRIAEEAKIAQAHAEQNLSQIKWEMELKVLALINENARLKDKLRYEIEDIKPKSNVNNSEISDNEKMKIELVNANKRIMELEKKLENNRNIQEKFEVQTVQLQNLKIKIEMLESERSIWEDGKCLVRKAAEAHKLENELHLAKRIIASLRESLRKDLFFEEEITSLKKRLECTESFDKQDIKLEVAETKYLPKIDNGSSDLSTEVNRLQHSEVLLEAKENHLKSKIQLIKKELINFQLRHEESKMVLAKNNDSYEKLNKLLKKLQKKKTVISRKREIGKQTLNLQNKENVSNIYSENTSINNFKVPTLDHAIEGYRILAKQLESDLEFGGNRQQEECKRLKEEMSMLKNELQYCTFKSDFGLDSKIPHFTTSLGAKKNTEDKSEGSNF